MLIKLLKTFCGQQSPIRPKSVRNLPFIRIGTFEFFRTIYESSPFPKIYLQLVGEIPLQTYSEIYLSMPPKNLGPKYPLKILDQEKNFTFFFPVRPILDF